MSNLRRWADEITVPANEDDYLDMQIWLGRLYDELAVTNNAIRYIAEREEMIGSPRQLELQDRHAAISAVVGTIELRLADYKRQNRG